MPTLEPKEASQQLELIYDEYRTACLNTLYYAHRLKTYQQINFWMETTIAIGAWITAGAAGFTLVKESKVGNYFWTFIALLSALLAVVKPIAKLAEDIEKYSKLWGSYNRLYHSFRILVQDIQAARSVTTEQIDLFKKLRQQSTEYVEADDRSPDRGLVKRLQEQVKQQIPASALWMPRP